MVKFDAGMVSWISEPKVMVVDDDDHVGRSIGRLLTLEDIAHEIYKNPCEALDIVKKSPSTFWLIISDQRMPEMKGTVFLERAKAISPETVCFLITADTEINTVMDSVNNGAVYKYILKPWDEDMLQSNIKSALKKFHATIENKMLLKKAITQTKQLYRLGNKMLATINRQKKTIGALTKEAEMLKSEIEHSLLSANQQDEAAWVIKEQLAPDGKLDMTLLTWEYRIFLQRLYKEFEALASHNSFSMPGSIEYDTQK